MNIFGMVTTTTSAPYTPYALESFFRCTPLEKNDRFYLIDNDGTWSPSIPVHPAVTMIRNDSPRGFAANVNQVLRIAANHKADLFFLNNDVIFTADWLAPLLTAEGTVIIPASNWKLQYRCGIFECHQLMHMAEYVGHEAELAEIARQNRIRSSGYQSNFIEGFFCVRIPHSVYTLLGPMDESFGIAGGEDTDYCFRCHLAGVPVLTAMQSYVLHFIGMSTWRGAASPKGGLHPEPGFKAYFIRKWGKDLYDMAVDSDFSALHRNSEAMAAFSRGDWRKLVQLLKRD